MIHLTIIYDVLNLFSMKNNKSSRKLRVGLNWYPGVNWSTTAYMYTLPLKEVFHLFKCEYCLSLRVFTACDELHWDDEIHWPTSTVMGQKIQLGWIYKD